jgi:putative transposase
MCRCRSREWLTKSERVACRRISWQNRFDSCPLDAGHCWAALRYVELNPVRAGMIADAWAWPWSSAAAHVGEQHGNALLDLDEWSACWSAETWRPALSIGVRDALFEERLRLATRTGRPFGAAGFAQSMEQIAERPLTPGKQGRKPLAPAASAGAQ